MKIMISFISIIIVALGIISFFGEGFFIPNSGKAYAIIVGIAGIIAIVAALVNQMLMGFEKFFLMVQGALLFIIGLLPFFTSLLSFLPRGGPVYGIMVIVVGALGLAYGLIGMG